MLVQNSTCCGIHKFNKVTVPRVIFKADDATSMLRRPYPWMAKSKRRALTTSVAYYQKRSHCRGRASGMRIVLSCLKGWKLPPHLLHPTKPSSCIYVEKTPEQYCLGSHNSWKVWGNKWRAKINGKMLYNVRNPPEEREDLRIGGENIVTTRARIVIKSRENIFKNYSPQILPREDFFA